MEHQVVPNNVQKKAVAASRELFLVLYCYGIFTLSSFTEFKVLHHYHMQQSVTPHW
jgi:hypothetical protein